MLPPGNESGAKGSEMDDYFSKVMDGPAEPEQGAAAPVVETTEPPAQQVEKVAPETASNAGETTAHANGQVPLAALEAERKGRQDWKEQAIRAQEAERQLREQLAQLQQPPQQQQFDPIQHAVQASQNNLLNASELIARQKYGTEKVDAAFAKWKSAADANPALWAQLQQSRDPWDAVVREGMKLQMLDEVGTDPVAYREKLKAELLAELNQGQAKPSVNLPQSLAGARSSGPRSGPQFTGPPPFKEIFG